MASIQDVLLGIEARLATIDGLRTSPIKPDQINPPQAIVGVPQVTDYQETYARSKYMLQPTITVLVSGSLDRVGQMQLAGYVGWSGATSIPAAVRADPTLGGAAEAAEVLSFRPLGLEEVGRLGYYGGLFVLRVMVREVPT